jgi:alpha,alpha-trehalase
MSAGKSAASPGSMVAVMRCSLAVAWCLSGIAHAAPVGPRDQSPPQVLFGDLFTAVQMRHVFPDNKLFPDAIPRTRPADILARYHAERPTTRESLRRFVDAHFSLPGNVKIGPVPAVPVPITTHIDQLWDLLRRSSTAAVPYQSLLTLPEPYVVPGGRFRELYYWDSYFTLLGLAESGRRDLAKSMVEDFASLIDRYGHVPNGTRTYYLSRSQPPFFFEMLALLSNDDPPGAFARYLPELKTEYAFWMQGAAALQPGRAHRRVVRLSDGSVLNRYWDDRDTPRDESYAEDAELAAGSRRPPRQLYRDIRAAAESGWDFSSRWFADPHERATIDTTQLIPVDLNSLLFGLENAIRAGCARRGDARCATAFTAHAAARRASIDRHLWDRVRGAYFDYRWTERARVTRVSAATLYPLFEGLASPAQAAGVAATVEALLLKPGGIVTTPVDTGQQWDAPNGWAPLQWIAVAGLRRYGDAPLAQTIACRWIANVEAVYLESGKLVEKYDVTRLGLKGGGGEYPLQDGFGWTNGVTRKLMSMYGGTNAPGADASGADACP